MANSNDAVIHLALLILCLCCGGNALYTGHFTGQDLNKVFEINVFPEDLKQLLEPLPKDVDYSKPVPEMISDQGYTCEVHDYTTDDGYINTLHRILPRGNKTNRVVFLQHGLLGTSSDYVMGSTENSLGFFLASLGYDVWLGNARGNTYSRRHVSLSADDSAYWNFSWDQMGKYDLPAAFSKVQEVTKAEKITYIGHSMGTTMFWVAMSEHPDLKDVIDVMIAMGPVAKVKNMISPIRYLAPFSREAEFIFHLLGIDEFLPSTKIVREFVRLACDQDMLEMEICENLTFLLTGFDKAQANLTMLPYILGHHPGGTSTRTIVHYGQMVESGRFCKYDLGPVKNMKTYNRTTPPEYDLSKTQIPVALIWANNDWLADPKDVKFLINNLPNLMMNYKVPFENFNHVDFIWGIDANKFVYQPIKSLLEKTNNQQ